MIGDWEDFRVLLAVLRAGGFAAAGARLGPVPATVRRRLERFEVALGGPLFVRTGRTLAPTASGLELKAIAESMERVARGFAEAVVAEREQARGVVRVQATEVLGEQVLPPILAEVMASHPGIAIEMSLDNGPLILGDESPDLAVMFGSPTPDDLLRENVGSVEFGLFGRRDLFARQGRPSTLTAVRGLPLVGGETAATFGTPYPQNLLGLPADAFGFRTDSFGGQFAAVCAGVGLGVCQVPMATRYPELERVCPHIGRRVSLWLVMHPSQTRVRRVCVVRDALREGLMTYVASGKWAEAGE